MLNAHYHSSDGNIGKGGWPAFLDARSKLLVSMVFIIVVLSFDRLTIAALIPFLAFPFLLALFAEMGLVLLLKRILLVSLFAVFIGIWSPFLEREPEVILGPCIISRGWAAFISLYIKFILTAATALILLATTGIHGICTALNQFHFPKPFINQILLLHRYIFVLSEDISRTNRARLSRSFGRKGLGAGAFIQMLTRLLLASIERAQRIHLAMLSRGFNGEFHFASSTKWRSADSLYFLGCTGGFLLFRFTPITLNLGKWLIE